MLTNIMHENVKNTFITKLTDTDPLQSPPPANSYRRFYPENAVPPVIPRKGYGTLVSYSPGREDFEQEWEPNAEVLIQNIRYDKNTTELQRRINDVTLRIYANKIKEREVRKAFLISRDLMKTKKDKVEKSVLPVYKYCTNEEMSEYLKTRETI
eukprot:UN34445